MPFGKPRSRPICCHWVRRGTPVPLLTRLCIWGVFGVLREWKDLAPVAVGLRSRGRHTSMAKGGKGIRGNGRHQSFEIGGKRGFSGISRALRGWVFGDGDRKPYGWYGHVAARCFASRVRRPRDLRLPATNVLGFSSRKNPRRVQMLGGLRSGTGVPRRTPTTQMGPHRGFPEGKNPAATMKRPRICVRELNQSLVLKATASPKARTAMPPMAQ